MNEKKSQSVRTAHGLPAAPVMEVRERFGTASVLFQALIVAGGLGVFSVASPPAAAFLGVAIALRLAWMLTHRRTLVWDGRDVWLATGRSHTHATRGGAGEIRQLAVRRSGSPEATVTHRYYVIVDAAGSATVRLPIGQWNSAELSALAAEAGIALTDYGLVPVSDAAVLDPSPSDWGGLVAVGVVVIAGVIAMVVPS